MPSFRGKPACQCLVEWLPVYERLLIHRGVLPAGGRLTIYQLIGKAAASASTHSKGGAFDISNLPGNLDVVLARQMGADATWHRTRAQGFSVAHLHGVLTGCIHNKPARYQITAVRAGFNGLGWRGRKGKDDGPRPLSGRTWREGIAWAKQQMEDDMPLSDEDIKRIAAAVWDADVIPIESPVMTPEQIAKNPTWTAKGALGKLLKRQAQAEARERFGS